MSLLDLREDVIKARGQHRRGEISYEDMILSAELYITALKAAKKAKTYRGPVPASAAYLIRAL